MKLILASASPRRLELLKELGYPFSVCLSPFEEKDFSLDPVITATAFAKGKAQTVFNGLEDKETSVVVGADTVVYLDGEILGKPKNSANAKPNTVIRIRISQGIEVIGESFLKLISITLVKS